MTINDFENLHLDSTRSEGWVISAAGSNASVEYQIQKIDDPDLTPVYLKDDSVAWEIVMNGTEPHHIAARSFIEEHSPKEWDCINKYMKEPK